ncbi:MAG: pilus assembly protein TadG-related protein [Jiangellaceae bacterium]
MNRRRDDGQVTLVIIGFVWIGVVLVGVVANASKAFVYRRSLASWADGAAVAAAQNVAEDVVYTGPVLDDLPISADGARGAVTAYVARHGLAERFEDFDAAVAVDPAAATVTVAFRARMSLVLAGDVGGIPITAEATATAPLD